MGQYEEQLRQKSQCAASSPALVGWEAATATMQTSEDGTVASGTVASDAISTAMVYFSRAPAGKSATGQKVSSAAGG